MIIGVDHIGWSLPRADGAACALEDMGYTRAFEEPSLRTALEKAPLLRTFSGTHRIEYWRHRGAPAVETIVHPLATDTVPNDFPTVVCGPIAFAGGPEVTGPLAAGLTALRLDGRRAILAPTHTSVIRADRRGPIQAYVVLAPDPDEAAAVWCSAIGARVLARGDGFIGTRIDAPLPHWRLDVLIAEGRPRADEVHLDDEGFLSVGLLTSDLASDRRRLEAAGIAMTRPFAIAVNGKQLAVTLGRGRGGEVLELIALA